MAERIAQPVRAGRAPLGRRLRAHLELADPVTWITPISMVICGALVVPLSSQVRLYREPTHRNFLRYIIASNPFILLIQLISAFIVGGYFISPPS